MPPGFEPGVDLAVDAEATEAADADEAADELEANEELTESSIVVSYNITQSYCEVPSENKGNKTHGLQ
jgi:hypothetical protein